LNIITVKNRGSFFLISETLRRLYKIKIYIKLDIISVFNRFRIREDDKKLTVFCIRFGFFKYFVISFGLYNGPVSFQHYVNDILREYLDDFYIIYLDDILIYSEFKIEHEIHVRYILQKFREADL